MSSIWYHSYNYAGKGLIMRLKINGRGALLIIVIAVVMLTFLTAIPKIFAQTSTNDTGSGNNLKLSPLRTDVQIRPGESRNIPIFVENLESKPVILKPIENDFIAGDEENGSPSIILDENEFAPTHSLKRFMIPLEPITLQAGERREVKVTINVPATAQAGGYYGALRFAPLNPDGSEIVNVSGSVASLILLTVPGNLVESLQLTDFDIRQDGEPKSRLSSPEGVTVTMKLENKGNVHVAPFGTVLVIKDGEEVFNGKVNNIKPAGVVLPDSVRQYEIPIENLENFGNYTFKLVAGYGTNGQTIEIEKSVWIIPTLYIILAIGGLIVLLILITIITMALKAYKRKILRGSRRR
jgi:hypothetical protein